MQSLKCAAELNSHCSYGLRNSLHDAKQLHQLISSVENWKFYDIRLLYVGVRPSTSCTWRLVV